MKLKIAASLIILLLFVQFLIGTKATLSNQNDEYTVFMPLVLDDRCVLPESTKAECLR